MGTNPTVQPCGFCVCGYDNYQRSLKVDYIETQFIFQSLINDFLLKATCWPFISDFIICIRVCSLPVFSQSNL